MGKSSLNLCPADLEQRPVDLAEGGPNSGEARQSGTEQDAQEQCFRLVVGVMGGQDHRSIQPLGDLGEKTVSVVPGEPFDAVSRAWMSFDGFYAAGDADLFCQVESVYRATPGVRV